MCVIILAGLDTELPVKRLTPEMVSKAFSCNSEGAGIAYRDGGIVHWEKGLELGDIQRLCAEVPLPYVAHFRISTCGGKRADLCHPFPIDKEVPLFTSGTTKGYVLFHNGHWGDWKKEMYNGKFQVPKGKWSDSRAMALMAAYRGHGVLDLIDEKAVILGPEDYEVFGTGWIKVKDDAGVDIWCSNSNFNWRGHHEVNSSFTMCRERQCTKPKFCQTDYCLDHLCKEPMCTNQRIGYTEFCFAHKDKIGTHPPVREAQLATVVQDVDDWDNAQSGFLGLGGIHHHGSRRDTAVDTEGPFREGPKTVEGGEAVKQETAESPSGDESAIIDGKELAEALKHARRNGEVLDIKKWVRGLNPKKYHCGVPSETDLERIKRVEDAKKGILRVGPM